MKLNEFISIKRFCFNVFMNIYSVLPCGVAIILQLLRLVYLTEDEMQTLQQI